MIKKLNELVEKAKNNRTKRIAVAAAGDLDVLEAIKNAKEEGIVEPILVGDEEIIKRIAKDINFDLEGIEIIHEPDKFGASAPGDLVMEEYGFTVANVIDTALDLLKSVHLDELNRNNGKK